LSCVKQCNAFVNSKTINKWRGVVTPILSAFLALALMCGAAQAGKADRLKPARVAVTEPETKRVRTIRVDPCEVPFSFEEVWRCRVK